jgi:hypothetical protein
LVKPIDSGGNLPRHGKQSFVTLYPVPNDSAKTAAAEAAGRFATNVFLFQRFEASGTFAPPVRAKPPFFSEENSMSFVSLPKFSDSPSLEMINEDQAIFTSGDRVYRISNLSNNRLVGKLIILIKAYTTSNTVGYANRINILNPRSRKEFALFVSERWSLPQKTARQDMAALLEQLQSLGYDGRSNVKSNVKPGNKGRV